MANDRGVERLTWLRIDPLLVFAFASLFVGCAAESTSVAEFSVLTADSAGIRTVTVSGPVAALPEWTLSDEPLTEISGDAPPFIGSVGTVAFHRNEELLAGDRQSNELRSYSREGQILQLLGGDGDGPGEFKFLTQLSSTAGDTIHAFDGRHSRFTAFTPDGALLSTIPVRSDFAGEGTSVLGGWALGDDRFVLHGLTAGATDFPASPRLTVRDHTLHIVSADGTAQASPVQFGGGYRLRYSTGGTGSLFSNRPFVAVNGDRIVNGSGLEYELTVRGTDLEPLTIVRWSGWRQPLTESMIDDIREPMAASIPEVREISPAAADRLVNTQLDPDIVPERLPALGSALLDEAGRIWIARFRLSPNLRLAMVGRYENWEQEDAWHVLDADGTPLARVRLPPRTRLLAVRTDRVAVVTRDERDVEHIRVLAIDDFVSGS